MNNSEKKRAATPVYIALLVAGIIAGGLGVYLLAPGTDGGGSMDTAATTRAADAGRKVKYWQAPMDPTYIRMEPGKSPMGMDLVPVYEDGAPEPGTVSIDPVTVQNIGVRTKRAEVRKLTKTIRTVGRVDYDEKRVHHVNTKIEGWVEKLYVDFTGQEVEKDDYLLEIYSPKLVATQEEYLLARSYRKSAPTETKAPEGESVLELAKRRLELWDMPAHQIRELEESGQIKKTVHIHSPAKGIVVEKPVQEGMFVKPGVNLYTIADLSKVWVYADVYEYEMSWVRVGQEAEMTLAAYPGSVFRGRVSFINPFMEPKTRTVKVRLEFDNPDGRLKPDMFANITLSSQRGRDSVVVPAEAVLLSGERSLVIVARGGGRFMPREVRLGAEAEDHYEVTEGLSAGEEVVTSAHFLIDSESRLKEAITKMLDADAVGGGAAPAPMEGMDHSGMDHSGMDAAPMDHGDMEHEDMDHSGMDHSGMDHSNMDEMDHGNMEEMDHSDMDHGGMEGMEHEGMDHSNMDGMDHDNMEEMDHSDMDHEGMDHDGMEHEGMDHENMNHDNMENMDHSDMNGMDHGTMDHENMDGMDHEHMDHSEMPHDGMEGTDR